MGRIKRQMRHLDRELALALRRHGLAHEFEIAVLQLPWGRCARSQAPFHISPCRSPIRWRRSKQTRRWQARAQEVDPTEAFVCRYSGDYSNRPIRSSISGNFFRSRHSFVAFSTLPSGSAVAGAFVYPFSISAFSLPARSTTCPSISEDFPYQGRAALRVTDDDGEFCLVSGGFPWRPRFRASWGGGHHEPRRAGSGQGRDRDRSGIGLGAETSRALAREGRASV